MKKIHLVTLLSGVLVINGSHQGNNQNLKPLVSARLSLDQADRTIMNMQNLKEQSMKQNEEFRRVNDPTKQKQFWASQFPPRRQFT